MYPLKPDKIYAHDELRSNPDAMTRMQRFLAAMGFAESAVDWYTPTAAVRVAQEVAAWVPGTSRPDWKLRQPIVFTRFALSGTAAEDPVFANRPTDIPLFNLKHILGYLPIFTPHHTPEQDAATGMTCWPSMFLSSVDGCSHGCVYCGNGSKGKALVIALNVHDYLQQGVRKVIDDNPWQKCFLMMGAADIATL